MPQVLVGAAAAGGLAVGTAALAGGALGWSTFLTPFASQLVLGGLAAALAPKPKSADFTALARDRTHVIRSTVAPRRIVYGETVVSGPLVAAAATGATKEFLHLVVALAGHEVDYISDVYFNDLVSSAARFAGHARVKAALGTDGQVADSDLVAEVAEWTADHRLRGIAYIYVRLTWNADVWPTGIPNVKALLRGRKLYDPRDAGTRWSNNPALVIRDYLTAAFGLQCAAAEIDDASFIAAANVCDETVAITATADDFTADAASDLATRATLNSRWQRGDTVRVASTGTLPGGLAAATDYYLIPVSAPGVSPGTFKLATTYANALAGTAIDIASAGSGTHTVTRTGQARYACDGAFELDMKPLDVIEHLVASCAGALVYSQGRYRLHAGAATAATADLAESDLRGQLRVRPKAPRRELANAIKGTYVEPWAAWQPADFPPVLNAAYEAEDGGSRIEREMHFAFCQDQTRAQRLAKIALETARQGIAVEFPAKLTALKVAVWDVTRLAVSALGWTNKEFRVAGWQLAEDGGVDLRLQEYAASVYAWNSGEATLIDPAPDTDLPDPFTVVAPTGLTLASGTAHLYLRRDGTVFSRIKASWTAPADVFVTSGGQIEVEHKKSSDGVWENSHFVAGADTQAFILDVQDGVSYDVRIRAVNSVGRQSAWVTEAGHVVQGKTAKPSDVTGLAAQQNANMAVMRWNQVSDIDLSGYEIRYGLSATWSLATPLTKVTKGTHLTTGSLPPGNWVLLIKAFDTSGNESLNAGSTTLNMLSGFDVIRARPQAPDWLGVKTGFLEHEVSARLVPDSLSGADDLEWEVFDQFVPNPVSECIYDSPEEDLGFDTSNVRVWFSVQGALGPGEVAGAFAAEDLLDYRLAAGAYDGYEPWAIGVVPARYFKARTRLVPANGIAYLSADSQTYDSQERTESGRITVGVGGSSVSFAKQFHLAPFVTVTPDATTARYAVKYSVTTTGFSVKVFDSSGTDVGGPIDWVAAGV